MFKLIFIGLEFLVHLAKTDEGWTSDIKIEINLPVSSTDDTDIYISKKDEEEGIKISVNDCYSYETDETSYYAYQEASITVNKQGESSSETEKTIVVSTLKDHEENYEFIEADITYKNTEGGLAEINYTSETETNETTINSTQVVYEYIEQKNTNYSAYNTETEENPCNEGISQVLADNYIIVESSSDMNENGTYYQTTEICGEYAGVSFNDTKTQSSETDGLSESGVAYESWNWWTNTQEISEKLFDNFGTFQ